jgi:Protein of unknown function (DUF2591)
MGTIMKHKTKELTGALLDAAVAIAEGADVKIEHGELANVFWPLTPGRICYAEWRPSMDWSQGGSIIERELLNLAPDVQQVDGRAARVWVASAYNGEHEHSASSPLIAAMRAYVAYKLGEEVELP